MQNSQTSDRETSHLFFCASHIIITCELRWIVGWMSYSVTSVLVIRVVWWLHAS